MIDPSASSFPMKRLKHVVSLRRSRVDSRDGEQPYVGLENIESWTGRLVGDIKFAGDGDNSASASETSLSNMFEPGDVLFGKLRPYLAKAWVADFSGCSSTEFLVMQPVELEPRFLRYVCVWQDFVDAVDASTLGSKMPRAEWDYVGTQPVPLPTYRLQHAIANYLDRETSRINALIGVKERLLALLAEKRHALITRAVTRGLEPNVPMRDSGIPWLGEIPEHWEVERARWLFKERDERSLTGSEDLLTVSHLTGVTLRSEKEVNMFEAETKEGYKLCYPGDLVINTLWAWMGAMGVARMNGMVSPAYHVYHPLDGLEPDYVDTLARLPLFAQAVTRYSKGVWSSRLRLYPEGFFEVWLPVPPLNEQLEIVRTITAKCRLLDDLTNATKQAIDLLKERRTALITAAVTGQTDVGIAA